MPMRIAHIHRNPGPPLIFLADDEPELQRAWEILAHQEQSDTLAEHAGEVWQYMGTTYNSARQAWTHEFRHRHHPRTGEREYRCIPAILALTLAELQPGPASYKVTYTTEIGFNGTETIYGIYTNALLIVGIENYGARIYFGDATLVDRKLGDRYLPDSILLDWARQSATPTAPAFAFHVDPVDAAS